MAFDQWATFYNHYVVLGSKMTATFCGTSNDPSGMNVCGVHLSDDTTTTTDVTHMLELGLTNFKAQSRSAGQATNVRKVTKGFSAKKYFHLTNVNDNTARVGSVIGGNPSDSAFFCVFHGATNSLIDPPAVDVTICIDYIVLFSEPRELSQS